MADALSNRVREHRHERGWSQAELARRTGLSRPEISAVETGRLVPSTAAALGIASALGLRVEDLFSLGGPENRGWAWAPKSGVSRYWQAAVGSQVYRFPVERTLLGTLPHDGVEGRRKPTTDPHRTVVLAGCDPAVGVLASELQRRAGLRLLPFVRSSRRALELLAEGKVHLAGVHLGGNIQEVRSLLGAGPRLVRVADWQAGLALAPGLGYRSVAQAVRANLRWVNREEGSGARQCFDRIMRDAKRLPRGYRHHASDHTGVVEIIRSGWAQAGICVRLVAQQAGLDFLSVRREPYELCSTAELAADSRIQAVIDVLCSDSFSRTVADLPGYDTTHTGEVRQVK